MEYNNNFDFEKWSELAVSDPDAFESYREEVINQFIQDLPEERQHRMRCLQWRVDSIRKISKTPMAACIEISRMMWESVQGENGLLDTLHCLKSIANGDVVDTSRFTLETPTKSANILDFPIKPDLHS